MKKLIIALSMFTVVGTVSAKPSSDDAKQIGAYCDSFSGTVSQVYILKDNGFDKKYVVKMLLNQGYSKELVEVVTDTAYELKSGMTPTYVKQGVKKFCISAVTEGQAK